ncbi:MAG: porin family protein [Bacteroidota bacterium]
MKKKFQLLLLIVCTAQYLSAQENEKPVFKKFGFVAGVNFSHMNFNKGVPPPPVPVSTNWRPGLFFGFLLQVQLANNLSLQPEYLYSQLGGEIKSSKTVYKLNYLSMPVLLKYQVSSRIAAMAGPQFDLLINAKKDSSGNSYNITHDTEERNFGLAFGMEINHVGIGQRSDVREFKYEDLQVSACIRF